VGGVVGGGGGGGLQYAQKLQHEATHLF